MTTVDGGGNPPATRAAGSHRVGPLVGVSIIAGFVAAVVFVVGPFAGQPEPVITGSVLLAFALGWGLLLALTTRWSDQPQRWAAVPAAYMALTGGGLLLLAPSAGVMDVLSWVWPPVLLALVVWMVIQARRHLNSHARRWLLYPVFAVLLLMAVGGGYETVQASMGLGAMPGQLVDVGGHKLHIACAGSGGPTVVLESGAGEDSIYWARIAPVVAATTRVCTYDRPGRGWSEPAAAQDGLAVATELHTLLAASGNAGPYLLVGHSTGGPYVEIFAAKYTDEVAGMVLLDAQPADAFTSLPDFPAIYSSTHVGLAPLPSVARLGLFRLAHASDFGDLPPQARDAERADQSSPGLLAGERDEFAMLRDTLREAGELKSLGNRPLAVVTAGAEDQTGWLAAQERLPALSTNSVHYVLPNATHVSLIEKETDAAVSSQTILDVVASARTGSPLLKRPGV